MTAIILEAHNLTKSYPFGDRSMAILDAVSLAIAAGEFVVVAGSSGSGKTTLLTLLSGLDKPTSGRVIMAGQDITDLSEDNLARLRNEQIGFVFQGFHLVPSLNALENVMFPAELKKDRQAGEKAARLLQRVGLWERRRHFPEQLSGGEKQRVAICRAIIDLLTELHREQGTTLVLATHSADIADRAQRTIRLSDGCLSDDEDL